MSEINRHTTTSLFNVDLHDFQAAVIERSFQQPILVDFWAEWCSPCIAIAPTLQRVIENLDGAVALAKLEVDEGENMKLAGHYRVRGFPTIILFRDGLELGRFSGNHPARYIQEFIQSNLSPS